MGQCSYMDYKSWIIRKLFCQLPQDCYPIQFCWKGGLRNSGRRGRTSPRSQSRIWGYIERICCRKRTSTSRKTLKRRGPARKFIQPFSAVKGESMKTKEIIVPQRRIENRIFVLRGHKVMLGPDLAELYGIETWSLVQGVKRNRERFPADFMFALTRKEILRISQIVISLKYSKSV